VLAVPDQDRAGVLDPLCPGHRSIRSNGARRKKPEVGSGRHLTCP
jgi:hypothetical protein